MNTVFLALSVVIVVLHIAVVMADGKDVILKVKILSAIKHNNLLDVSDGSYGDVKFNFGDGLMLKVNESTGTVWARDESCKKYRCLIDFGEHVWDFFIYFAFAALNKWVFYEINELMKLHQQLKVI